MRFLKNIFIDIKWHDEGLKKWKMLNLFNLFNFNYCLPLLRSFYYLFTGTVFVFCGAFFFHPEVRASILKLIEVKYFKYSNFEQCFNFYINSQLSNYSFFTNKSSLLNFMILHGELIMPELIGNPITCAFLGSLCKTTEILDSLNDISETNIRLILSNKSLNYDRHLFSVKITFSNICEICFRQLMDSKEITNSQKCLLSEKFTYEYSAILESTSRYNNAIGNGLGSILEQNINPTGVFLHLSSQIGDNRDNCELLKSTQNEIKLILTNHALNVQSNVAIPGNREILA